MTQFAGRWTVGLLFALLGCTGSSVYMKEAPRSAMVPHEKALVYFMRPSGMGAAVNFQIWDGDHLIGVSQSKCYFAYEASPGKHMFIGVSENKVGVSAELDAGKTYYVLIGPRMGAWRSRLAMVGVRRGMDEWTTAERYLNDLQCTVPVQAQLLPWEQEHRSEALEIAKVLESPQGAEYVTMLTRDDGK